MARLWIGNIAPETSDDEVKALLVKYGFPEYDGIERVAGDGTRPAVMVTFAGADAPTLEKFQARMQNLFWKDRRLNVSVMSESRWS
ncbi:MAG TPA: RNA-binding protein [Burkholderiales bacterium]|nr:RNA-binding protein [Burkholderiales bacterium]